MQMIAIALRRSVKRASDATIVSACSCVISTCHYLCALCAAVRVRVCTLHSGLSAARLSARLSRSYALADLQCCPSAASGAFWLAAFD